MVGREIEGQMSGDSQPTVSVVIPTYNRVNRLRAVLDPLLTDPATAQVVVVVDGCQDGSKEHLEAWAAADARLVPVWQENAGANAARETGLLRAVGEVVLFLDDDVVAQPGLVTGHARRHTTTPHALVVGYMPTVVPQRRRAGQFASLLYAADYEKVCAAYEQDATGVLLNLWFGNVSLRRRDVLRIGLTRPGAPIYHEDKEFGFRCMAAGLTPIFDRSLRADHHHHRELDGFVREVRLQAEGCRALREHYREELIAAADLTPHVPVVVRRILAAATRPGIYPLVYATIMAVVERAGALHAWPVETGAARVLRQVELSYVDTPWARTSMPAPRYSMSSEGSEGEDEDRARSSRASSGAEMERSRGRPTPRRG
jgi:glycosyltransferase involved in cell wall biosynthesis